MSSHITLLPDTIAVNTAKIELPTGNGETARAVLVVFPGGNVKPHSHAKEDNPNSEVYIDLMEILEADDNYDEISEPQVAGENSPTGITEHSIPAADETQVFLAIKKSQEKGEWTDLNEAAQEYVRVLQIETDQVEDETIQFLIDGETVTINTEKSQIFYVSKDNTVREFASLESLKRMQQEKDIVESR